MEPPAHTTADAQRATALAATLLDRSHQARSPLVSESRCNGVRSRVWFLPEPFRTVQLNVGKCQGDKGSALHKYLLLCDVRCDWERPDPKWKDKLALSLWLNPVRKDPDDCREARARRAQVLARARECVPPFEAPVGDRWTCLWQRIVAPTIQIPKLTDAELTERLAEALNDLQQHLPQMVDALRPTGLLRDPI